MIWRKRRTLKSHAGIAVQCGLCGTSKKSLLIVERCPCFDARCVAKKLIDMDETKEAKTRRKMDEAATAYIKTLRAAPMGAAVADMLEPYKHAMIEWMMRTHGKKITPADMAEIMKTPPVQPKKKESDISDVHE